MGLMRRIKKELAMRDTFAKGYPRLTASRWYNATRRDNRLWKNVYSAAELEKVHAQGYLAKNIAAYDLLSGNGCERISDLDYLFLRPMNNSFAKWIEDINTMTRMNPKHAQRLPKIYFSITNRNGLKILDYPFARRKCGVEEIVEVLQQVGTTLQLRPAFWASKNASYDVRYLSKTKVLVNGTSYTLSKFQKLLRGSNGNYLLCEKLYYDYPIEENWTEESFLKFYLINGTEDSRIACALIEVLESGKEQGVQYLIDRTAGTFEMDGRTVAIPRWQEICEDLLAMSGNMMQLRYYSVSIVLTEDGYKISNANFQPYLPRIPFDSELNDYLKAWAAQKKTVEIPFKQKYEAIKNRIFAKFVGKFCRPGIRPYMQKLWFSAVKSDLSWKGTTLSQKIWAWKRGFLSFRIGQYGLTEENYQDHLSDYDYHWLNRMNNVYQAWISDKTTFRYSMEPLKEYIPDYYFSVFKRDGETVVARMQDCPENIGNGLDGIVQILRQDSILVFKPSAGLHGDGFYCIEYRDNAFWINGKETDEEGIKNLIRAQRSVYVVTSYIHMHPDLKKIYPKSVNSIRVMAINRHGYDPKILQTYMRIGSSKTGYTDNVGYGGICAMIDIETGMLYDPETLRDHVYYPCPQHPDTGTEIAGIVVPHWPLICEKVGEICQLIPELEYLGFDVAVMEDGFQIMEINVHQDLHKVAKHAPEVRAYYKERIEYKKRLFGVK